MEGLSDPMHWTDYVSVVANAVTALSAAAVAVFAWKGLSAWKDELVGKRKTELAEDVLADFYQASDLIKAIRSPFSYPDSESADRPGRDQETDDQRRVRDAHYVPIARIEKRSEFFSALLARRYRMKAYFGEQVDLAFDALNTSLNKIQTAAAMMMRYSGDRFGTPSPDRWRKWEETIWAEYADEGEDEIKNLIEGAVSKIEEICGPVLEGSKRR